MEWLELKEYAVNLLKERNLIDEYEKRLNKELYEIEKQGANGLWVDYFNNKETWLENPNGLVIPWLLGMTQIDPVASNIPHKETYQTDFPDIDLDFLPLARETIKNYAIEKYKYVCSVGNWVTFKPKSALQDVARALGIDARTILDVTSNLPDEFDDLDLEDHELIWKDLNNPDEKKREEAGREIARYKTFYDFKDSNPETVDIAYRLVGKLRTQSMHAGGVIIADRPIENLVPLSLLKKGWASQWTEGKRTQLSKFGLVKFDILGVKTIYYIWQAGNLIKKNFGITIDWSSMDPLAIPMRLGYEILKDGTKNDIIFDDATLKMTNELRTDSAFQIESQIQKGIIRDGKIRSFWDLVVYNALGRPGPMDCIPEYIKQRDDPSEGWKQNEDSRVIKILPDTYGVICYQEQLQAMWQSLAGFTVPEAEDARKIISKKWVDKLPKVEAKWKAGASKTIGEDATNEWWNKMVSFGRYAFNKSHAVAYSVVTFRCLWLKSHYPQQWWAAVMSECHPDKLPGYMTAAKVDGVQFGALDVDNLTHDFDVDLNNKVVPGIAAIKGIGEKASRRFTDIKGPFKSIEDVVEKCGKHKKVFERLIKLNAFSKFYSNRRGLWIWYQWAYTNNPEIKKFVRDVFKWSEEAIMMERDRQRQNFLREHPKRKVPKKIESWLPKINPPRDEFLKIIPDYTPFESLQIEKELLGYYWSSPMDIYMHDSTKTITKAKNDGKNGIIDVVIQKVTSRRSKLGNEYYVLRVSDGVQTADVMIWLNIYNSVDNRIFQEAVGVRLFVEYNVEHNSFKIMNGTTPIPLHRRGASNAEEVAQIEMEDYPLW